MKKFASKKKRNKKIKNFLVYFCSPPVGSVHPNQVQGFLILSFATFLAIKLRTCFFIQDKREKRKILNKRFNSFIRKLETKEKNISITKEN